jgi:putative component of toxin-antitoxin plasmid stabilization module
MGTGPLWKFYAYRTPAGNEVVQEWFDAQDDDLKDEIRDSLQYHQNVERHLWKRPGFDELGGEGISEFRFSVRGAKYRIFGPVRHAYTLLLPAGKDTRNQRHEKNEGKKRKGQLERREASVHEFRWQEDSD